MMPNEKCSQKGTAILAVLVLGALVGAVAVALWGEGMFRRGTAQRRLAKTKCVYLAQATVWAAAGWFEEAERGSLVPPPEWTDVDPDRREVDPEGDGEGVAWEEADPPWNCRYKVDSGGVPFRPPDGPEPGDQFLGTAEGPDVILLAGQTGAGVLDGLARAIDPEGGFVISHLSFFRPPAGSGPDVLATVEGAVEIPLPGSLPARAVVRAEIVLVDWGRWDRPLLVGGDASLEGTAGWEQGEAWVSGDMNAAFDTVAGWPGGIPWFTPDQPLREDLDGDGAQDDVDGDGQGDWIQWRDQPGAVPDPWWRARIGGAFNGAGSENGVCFQPFPFGPRAIPPVSPSKSSDRSGVFGACPATVPFDPLPSAWTRLAGRGIRGTMEAFEDPTNLGMFQQAGDSESHPIEELIPERGGLYLLHPAAGRTEPLHLTLSGQRGAWLIQGSRTEVSGGAAPFSEPEIPGAPRDTAGQPRPGREEDPYLEIVQEGVSGWQPGAWQNPGEGLAPLQPASGGAEGTHFTGLLATSGQLRLEGPLYLHGQVRSSGLEAAGLDGPVVVKGAPIHSFRRPGPPGVPRIVLENIRVAD